MGIVTELIIMAFSYVVTLYQQTMQYVQPAMLNFGGNPIFNIERHRMGRMADLPKRQKIDLSSDDAVKGTVGAILELLVSPNLSSSDKETIRNWDNKVDAVLAMAVFVPDAINTINDQVKAATGGKLDIYDFDRMMHKLLGKREGQGMSLGALF